MLLSEAKNLATSLMQHHGLKGWNFAFDRAKKCFGQCLFKNKKITLSMHLTSLNSETQVKETILHEIAPCFSWF